MNFSSHQKKLVESIEIALCKSKVDLINDFKPILNEASKLFKTDRFQFWLQEIGQHKVEEIPMTNYGLTLARQQVRNLVLADRNSVQASISYICECIFTYFNDNDMCFMQGDFHYYVNTELGVLFKESNMGVVEPSEASPENGNYRIALKSELKVNKNEFYV
jgi:hypothetical protein